MGGVGYDSPIPLRYQGTNAANPAYWPGGVTWTTQLGNWAATIENAFAQHNATYGTNYKFIPNLDARATSWEPNWYDNSSGVPFIDGAFLEGFGEYTDTYNWTLSMNRGLNLTDNGKIVIMQPYLTADPNSAAGQQQVNFLLGTYLLLKGDQTYLNIDDGGGVHVQYYPQYQLNLGTATTPLQSNVSGYLWNGVYRRDFQNGFVLVNPGSITNTLNLGGTYQEVQGTGGGTMTDAQIDANGNYIGGSLTYQNVSSITLTGGSAAIFLNPSGTGTITITNPAQASANPVTTTSVGVSVLGQENGNDNDLTYTWSSSGPAGVTFSVNGTNGAKNTTARFVHAGSFTLTATVSDGNQSVSSSVTITVSQTLTTLQVSPASATVPDGTTRQFSVSALDQFGDPLATQPTITWSIDGGGIGTINTTNGLYTAPASGTGSASVRATSDATSASATVTVVAAGTATFVKEDTTTQGTWRGVYGAQGYEVINNAASLPSYATITPSGQDKDTWTATTTDPRALQDASGSGRIAACWYAASSFTVNVNLTDGQTHMLALYFLDWDSTARSERVQMTNASTGAVLVTQTVSSFNSGVYLAFAISGNVNIRFTRLAGANAVLSGLFLNVTTTATFIKQDTTTQGHWIGTYGSQGYDVMGDTASPPGYATVTPAGQSSYTWAGSTTDPRALQNPGGSGRIAACWYAASSFTVNVNLTDGQTHMLALYFLDWDSTARSEQVQMTDASTGKVLVTQSVSSFNSGVYLVFAVSGNVHITFTRAGRCQRRPQRLVP